MSRNTTLGVLFLALVPGLLAQTPNWRHIGNSAMDLSLAGLATGPVDRVWYSQDGSQIYIRTDSGRFFETSDLDQWQASAPGTTPPVVNTLYLATPPEPGAVGRAPRGQTARRYAFGKYVYRSDDGGANWDNLTAFRTSSIVGGGIRDLAIDPADQDDVVIAGAAGVFRSVDGGRSWNGLNQGLPNLPGMRLRSLPAGVQGVMLDLPDSRVLEWAPGERTAWRETQNREAITEQVIRQAIGQVRGTRVTAVAIQTGSDYVYAGTAEGRIDVSPDAGRSVWLPWQSGDSGAVTRFWVDPVDPRVALAVLDSRTRTPGAPAVHVLHTINGGVFWDDVTGDLPDSGVYGVSADRTGGAVYVATAAGVFWTRLDVRTLGRGSGWTRVDGLPDGRVTDVRLDAGGNQLWVSVEGYGVYETAAPHRAGDPRVVSAADFSVRPAAPGSLLSVTGAKVDVARAGNLAVPVLAADATESQVQIPFDVRGESLALSIDGAGGAKVLGPLALGSTAPAIFVDRDGAPMAIDADSNVMLDAMHPAHAGARIQILAEGLGRVTPDWPAGMPAPLENPPGVVADVKAWLNGNPVQVVRAVLAPGYVGMYLVEVDLPRIVNAGPAELYIEAAGQESNRVRVYVEP